MCLGCSLQIFGDVTFKMVISGFFRFRTLALVWFWISIKHYCSILLLFMVREAYWFSATSLSKWPYGIFVFQTLQFGFEYQVRTETVHALLVCMGRNLFILSYFTFTLFQNGRLAAILANCFVSQNFDLVWLWISSPNFGSTLLICMDRSQFIFSDVTFKMATRRPYWIF